MWDILLEIRIYLVRRSWLRTRLFVTSTDIGVRMSKSERVRKRLSVPTYNQKTHFTITTIKRTESDVKGRGFSYVDQPLVASGGLMTF